MKKIYSLLVAIVLTAAVGAQTLNVKVGNITYMFPATQTGDMTYSDGTTLTVMGKTFNLSDVSSMTIDETEVTDNLVSITYDGTSATVTVAGNVAQYVEPTLSGAHVTIAQLNTDAIDGDEITYQLSGTTTEGEFALSGSYKCTVSLAGVTLTNASGAAINITNGKRIQISAKNGTENTLTDCSGGSQKGCIYSKGQIQLQGKGTLNVKGNTAHAIKSGDYISVKNLTLNITSAVKDGINCNEYFLMKSGNVSIKGVGDDGIQCELDGTTSTGETADHEDEDSGNIYIEDGTLTIEVTANDANGINSSGDMTISGGTLNLNATGIGGKCMKADGTLTISDGVITAYATGSSNDTYGSAKAIKAGTRTEDTAATTRAGGWPGGNGGGGGSFPGGGGHGGGGSSQSYTYSGGIVITGGTVVATSKTHEAIESKSTIDISGGYIYAEAGDDAINSASTFTITGGYVYGNSSGNDGLDANGNFYIKGGNVVAVAKSQPEVGIDANTEGGYSLYITGGNVVAIGGLENGTSTTGVSKSSVSYSKGSWYTFKNGSTTAFSFKVPSNSNMGSSMVICSTGTPSVSKLSSAPDGTTIWNGYGVINN